MTKNANTKTAVIEPYPSTSFPFKVAWRAGTLGYSAVFESFDEAWNYARFAVNVRKEMIADCTGIARTMELD